MQEIIEAITHSINNNSFDFMLMELNRSKLVLDQIELYFPINYKNKYLWDNIDISVKTKYNDNNEWKSYIIRVLNEFSDQLYLIPTDDEFYPWQVFLGKKSQVLDLIEDLYHFEYMLVDYYYKSIIFDTHHNELITINNPSNCALY